jgi:hypothetical protein
MATYVMLTRLTPDSVKSPSELARLERAVSERVQKECPQAFGHAQTETWTAVPWARFKQLIAA